MHTLDTESAHKFIITAYICTFASVCITVRTTGKCPNTLCTFLHVIRLLFVGQQPTEILTVYYVMITHTMLQSCD